MRTNCASYEGQSRAVVITTLLFLASIQTYGSGDRLIPTETGRPF